MKLKVALVHDYLNQYGGAERVLEVLTEMFPEAPIYTLLYDRERTFGKFDGRVKQTSFLDLPVVRRNHRPFIPFMPLAIQHLNLKDEYDVIISDTAGYAKGIRHSPSTFHFCYCYTPLRYAWEAPHYFKNPLFTGFFRPAFSYLKSWDAKTGKQPDTMVTLSRFIAGKIRDSYGRLVPVVYPSIRHDVFYPDKTVKKGDYYLAVGRLLAYKKFDLVIRAFKGLDRPLTIVGVGPEQEHLLALSKSLDVPVTFVHNASDDELRKLYTGARAFIFPQVEDFGLVAAEAQACGTPVIAYKAGGALEIVSEGKTGVFFDSPTPESLSEAIRRFEKVRFTKKTIQTSTDRFSLAQFKDGILSHFPEELRSLLV